MQHEKVNKVSNICSCCMAYCTNSHIINLLYSGIFANVNFTQSKLAKSLHLKIGAKVIKKLNTNKLNYKIMIKVSKKIKQTIERELPNEFSIVRVISIDSMYKELCVKLIALRGTDNLVIMRYFADDSYDILCGFKNWCEVDEELVNQFKRLV